MQTRNRNTFTTIHSEGALLPVDLLQRISENDPDLEGLTPESYHLAPGEKINEAINRSWNRLSGLWGTFQTARGRLGPSDAGTTLTRERWLLPLFQELGFGRLSTAKAEEIEGKSYPISHRWQNVPIHLIGCGLELDKRTPGAAGAARISPHSLLQEYLNRSEEALWGLVANGLGLRVLRDNATLTRQAYLEFDLEAMFEGEIYSDFVLLWLVCHQSRFEVADKEKECWLEHWSKSAQEQGTRALEDLRRGVEEAITSLGQGFQQHPLNQELRARLKKGDLSAQDYYRQLLRLVYRLIFLFAAEDRDLLMLPDAPVEARQRYQSYYSTARLRHLAERQRGSRHHDRYEALRLVMDLLGSDQGCPEIALPALGGFLFDPASTADLNNAKLDNQSLLSAVRSLAFIIENKTRRAVDYRNLGPEELGSVYESLLELHPQLNTDAGTFQLSSAAGNERKTTGSYYTPSSLIRVLLDSALDPVIEDRLKGQPDADQQEQALLSLKVCDPACGSGHFLIAAAHRIAGRLAQARAGGDEPSPDETRRALRDVIRHCIYGVDVNPMAVELCKVNLWLESLEPGKPLSFLDAHIQCGDSLVGVGPGLDISEIPDEAFKPAFGDDKATATALRRRNKRERGGQLGMRWKVTEVKSADDLRHWRATRLGQVEGMPEDDPSQMQAKAQAYTELQETQEYIRNRLEYDLWTAAFFWPIPKGDAEQVLAPTQQEMVVQRAKGELDVKLVEKVSKLAKRLNFFHWELAFPQVFMDKDSGFDCVLGNPPWETLQFEEQEFFATRDPHIASLPGELRKIAIAELIKSNPVLADAFEEAKHESDAKNKYLRVSNRFALSATGKLNTYALFAEHFHNLLSPEGFSGIILPAGIATDDSTKQFFGSLIQTQSLVRIIGFENEALIFPAVHHSFKFCALTMLGSNIKIKSPEFVFFCRSFEDIRSPERQFTLSALDIALINPNSGTTPIFRTRTDANLNRSIYQKFPILVNKYTAVNNWQIRFKQGLFNMTSDSGLFQTKECDKCLPLYEAKMIDHYDHRYGTYEGATKSHLNLGNLPQTTEQQKQNPTFLVFPRYWVASNFVMERLQGWKRNWLIGFRDVTSSISERTSIFSLLPIAGVGHTMPLIFFHEYFDTKLSACFLANMNTFTFDYLARQKVSGLHLTFTVLRQLTVLPPSTFSPTDIDFIAAHVLELVYTAYDLRPFAEDMGYHGEPFRWDEDRRALLRAELDAYYAKLYGLNRKQLRYILDPADLTQRELEDILDPWEDVADPLDHQGYDRRCAASDFPGETFRVLKEKEIKQFGEYRTRRLVLEAWGRLEGMERITEVEQPLQPAISLPAEIHVRQPLPEITWIPVTLASNEVVQKRQKPNYRQAVGVAWLLENFGTGQSIPSFDAQKYSYFLQRKNFADLDIPYHEAARGPYSSQLTYRAGAYAKRKNYWEVLGSNIARRRNMKEAVNGVDKVFADIEQARELIERLAQMSKDHLGGLATVDFASRAIFDKGQAITPDNIRAYFQSDWPEKVEDPWYTDENINQAMEMLSELGLFEKSELDTMQPPEVEEPEQEAVSQPTLTDFGLYKCETCGKMVMGYEKENHAREKHGGQEILWKKIR